MLTSEPTAKSNVKRTRMFVLSLATLHYITLHYITLHYITLHYTKCTPYLGIALATHFSSSSLVLRGLNLHSACSVGTDKQLSNVTSAVEYSKIVTAQQLGDRTMHIIDIFLRFMHISHLNSNIIVELRKVIQMRSNFKNSCFVFHRVFKRSKTIKPLGLWPRGFKCFSRLETR